MTKKKAAVKNEVVEIKQTDISSHDHNINSENRSAAGEVRKNSEECSSENIMPAPVGHKLRVNQSTDTAQQYGKVGPEPVPISSVECSPENLMPAPVGHRLIDNQLTDTDQRYGKIGPEPVPILKLKGNIDILTNEDKKDKKNVVLMKIDQFEKHFKKEEIDEEKKEKKHTNNKKKKEEDKKAWGFLKFSNSPNSSSKKEKTIKKI